MEWQDPSVDANYWRFDEAWIERPNPRINSMLFGELLHLISFDPCRLDCPAAASIANTLFKRLAQTSPIAAEALARQLARPVIVDEQDHRAWLQLELTAGGTAHIRSIEPIRVDWHAPPHSSLNLVVGQRVNEFGRLPGLPGSRHRVFRFDLG